jgi:pSer/pThr/pTyr-binding forkhead associated (FHA) protein
LASGRRIPLTRNFTVGRAAENRFVLQQRWVSRYHCVITRSLWRAWRLQQAGTSSMESSRGHNESHVRRGKRVVRLLPGQSWQLRDGDEIAFGRGPGPEGADFTHVFRDRD